MKKHLVKIKEEGGQSLVLAAVLLVVLLGFAALALDIGMMKMAESEMQAAADAAVYAAVEQLPNVSNATNTALIYGQLNGVEAANITVTTPYNGDAGQIEVVCTKPVQYTFAKVLGFDSGVATARAVAEKGGSPGGAFDYAIFCGSPTIESVLYAVSYVVGDIHSNNDFTLRGSQSEIIGDVEAVYDVTISAAKVTVDGNVQGTHLDINQNSTVSGSRITSSASYIAMPDLTSVMAAAIANADHKYSGYGNFGGTNLTFDGSIYVNGGFGCWGANTTFKGAILATGDINISATKLYLPGTDGIALYSANGNIGLDGEGAEIHGIVYAPNGNVRVGAKTKIYGMVIADSISFNGAKIEIYYDDSYLDAAGIGNGGESKLIE